MTQALCPVCAVSYTRSRSSHSELPRPPRVIALDPHTLGETLGDIRTLAQATDRRGEGVELVARTAARIDRVKLAVRGRRRHGSWRSSGSTRCILAGHWTPQLIEFAGGVDLLGMPGEPSRVAAWEEVAAAEPAGRGRDALRL